MVKKNIQHILELKLPTIEKYGYLAYFVSDHVQKN